MTSGVQLRTLPHFGLRGQVRAFQSGPAVAGSPHFKVNRASEENWQDYSIARWLTLLVRDKKDRKRGELKAD